MTTEEYVYSCDPTPNTLEIHTLEEDREEYVYSCTGLKRTRLVVKKDGSLKPIGFTSVEVSPGCFIKKPFYARRKKALTAGGVANKVVDQIYVMSFDELVWINV